VRESEEAASPISAIRILDIDHLAAVKLALKTKRLPFTDEDAKRRKETGRPRHERYSSGLSGIPVAEYYQPYAAEGGFSAETIQATEFLVNNRHTFERRALSGLNNREQVAEFVELCGNEQRLCALWAFTCADRAEWDSETVNPPRWFVMRELYNKALRHFRPDAVAADALRAAGYSEHVLAVLRDFGHDFYSGMYRKHALRFGSHLEQLLEGGESIGPKAALLRDRASTMVGVAAHDWRGVAACISGALWRQGIDLHQAHLFSAVHHGLALDFFHVSMPGKAIGNEHLRAVEQAIRERRFISPEDEASLPAISGTLTLDETHHDHYRLRLETDRNMSGLVYALTYKVFRHLEASIHALSAHASRGQAFISIYHNLPPGWTLEQARAKLKAFTS
jgi:UTP:GlnB (protein PII) uridylyltransferase